MPYKKYTPTGSRNFQGGLYFGGRPRRIAALAVRGSAKRAAAARMARALSDFGATPASTWGVSAAGTVAQVAAAAARSQSLRDMDHKFKYYAMTNFAGVDWQSIGTGVTAKQVDIIGGMAIDIGSGQSNRVGREITVTGLRLSFTVESGHSDVLPVSDEYDHVRIVIGLFRKPAQPAVTSAYFSANSANLDSPQLKDQSSGLIRVLHDQIVVLRPPYEYSAGTFAGTPATGFRHVRIYIPLSERIVFDSDSSLVGNDKQIVLMMASDSTVAPHPNIQVPGNITLFWRG